MDILSDIPSKCVLLAGEYFVDLVNRRGLIVRDRLPFLVTVVMVISDIFSLFLCLFGLILRKEFNLRVDFSSELIDELLKFIVVTV